MVNYINAIMDKNSVFFEKNTLYALFKGVTHRSVCLLLVAGISDDNVPYIPRKNIHFPNNVLL